MSNRTDAVVTRILDDLDADRLEAIAGTSTLTELPAYTGCVCTMREERPPVQEESLLSALIHGMMFR